MAVDDNIDLKSGVVTDDISTDLETTTAYVEDETQSFVDTIQQSPTDKPSLKISLPSMSGKSVLSPSDKHQSDDTTTEPSSQNQLHDNMEDFKSTEYVFNIEIKSEVQMEDEADEMDSEFAVLTSNDTCVSEKEDSKLVCSVSDKVLLVKEEVFDATEHVNEGAKTEICLQSDACKQGWDFY